MIPIPQYPLYTATLAQQSGIPVPYYLEESKGWSTDPPGVDRAATEATAKGIDVRAIVIINPGNPTGSLLDRSTMESIVKVCEKHSLVLLADEVYQSNLHDRENHPFTSFKKVVRDMTSKIPLISFHSISKGVTGECGRRGGYFECTNVPEDVIGLAYKMASVALCPPVGGQIGVDCLVRPPVEGDESYPLWKEETDAIHSTLAQRTRLIAKRLNGLPGVSCVESPGALYLFPRLHLPEKAMAAAEAQGRAPDTFYALALLDETGICAVSGDGFGQKEGEAHLRLTCLCAGVEEYIEKLEKFQRGFWEKYGGLSTLPSLHSSKF